MHPKLWLSLRKGMADLISFFHIIKSSNYSNYFWIDTPFCFFVFRKKFKVLLAKILSKFLINYIFDNPPLSWRRWWSRYSMGSAAYPWPWTVLEKNVVRCRNYPANSPFFWFHVPRLLCALGRDNKGNWSTSLFCCAVVQSEQEASVSSCWVWRSWWCASRIIDLREVSVFWVAMALGLLPWGLGWRVAKQG